MTSCKLGWCSCWTHMWSNQTYDYSIRLILCWRGRHLSDRAKNDKSDKARGFTLENIPCLLIVLLPLRADYTLQKPLMFWRFPLISYVDTNDNWLLWGYTLNMVLYLVVLFEEQWFIKIPRRVCQKIVRNHAKGSQGTSTEGLWRHDWYCPIFDSHSF